MILDKVSSTFWLVHEDLHEEKVIAALEYMSSMVATVEPLTPSPYVRESNLNTPYLEHSSTKGRFHVRIKRRNGRVRVIVKSLILQNFWYLLLKFTVLTIDSWCSIFSVKILKLSSQASHLRPFHLKMQSSIKGLYRRLAILILASFIVSQYWILKNLDLPKLNFMVQGIIFFLGLGFVWNTF